MKLPPIKRLLAMLVCYIVVSYSLVNAQSLPTWGWANGITGYYNEEGLGIDIDRNNNCYITGYYVTAGIQIGNLAPTPPSTNYDFILVKYDSIGNPIWYRTAEGNAFEFGNKIKVDSMNNILVLGQFNSYHLKFSNSTVYLSNAGYNYDLFLAQYSPNGGLAWVKRFGGIKSEWGKGMTIDRKGNIYLIGHFDSPDFPVENYTLTNQGKDDIYLIKLNKYGNTLWVKSIGGSQMERGYDVVTDKNDDVYITGSFDSPQIMVDTAVLTNSGITNFFVARYDGNGNLKWAKKFGNNQNDECISIAVDDDFNIYMTGWYHSNYILFDSIQLNKQDVNSGYIVQLDSLGKVNWAKSIYGDSTTYGTNVTVDKRGHIYLSGFAYGISYFIDTTQLPTPGANPFYLYLYLAKMTPKGEVVWGLKFGGGLSYDPDKTDYCSDMVANNKGSLYVVGNFGGDDSACFGNKKIQGNNYLTNSDIFVAQLIDNPTSAIEWKQANEVLIAPNPTSSQLRITTQTILQNATITLFNTQGQAMKTVDNISGHSTTISASELPNGMYYLQLIDKDKLLTIQKFIVEKP